MTVHYTRVLILQLDRSTPIPRLIFRFRPLLSVNIMNASRLQQAKTYGVDGSSLHCYYLRRLSVENCVFLSGIPCSVKYTVWAWRKKCRHQYATFRGGACLKLPDLLACSSSSSSPIGIIFEISKQLWIIAPEIIRFFGYKMHRTSDE